MKVGRVENPRDHQKATSCKLAPVRGQDIFVGIGKSATINNFKSRRGYVRDERLMLSNPTHHSWTLYASKNSVVNRV